MTAIMQNKHNQTKPLVFQALFIHAVYDSLGFYIIFLLLQPAILKLDIYLENKEKER